MVTKEDGETYFDGVIQDITERKTVENQMKQERDMLASAVEFQERIVECEFDLDRTLEVIGDSIQELIDPDGILVYFEDEGELRTKYVAGIDESRISDKKSIGGTVAGRCYRDRDVHFCRNTRECQEEPGVSNLFEGGSLLYVPLAHENQKFGVLEIFFREESHPGRVQENILRLVAGAVSSAIHMALQREEMEEYIDQIEEMARTDQLTGLTNRRDFMRRLENEANRAQRYDNRFSLVLLDLDHFKDVNDRYGHVTGDRVLEKVAELLESEVREPDTVARYGGEEFAVLLPETRLGEARNICERILEVMRNHTYEQDGSKFTVTCSMGLVEYHSEKDVEDLIRRVDRALYQAKGQGRDRYVVLD
jgi:diguanylate cyclase (GGDEF)-like protein